MNKHAQLRVIQWSTGYTGTHALRYILGNPSLEPSILTSQIGSQFLGRAGEVGRHAMDFARGVAPENDVPFEETRRRGV